VRSHLIVASRLTPCAPSPIVPVFVCFRARRGLPGSRLHQSRPSLLPSSSPGLVCLATGTRTALFVDLQRCPAPASGWRVFPSIPASCVSGCQFLNNSRPSSSIACRPGDSSKGDLRRLTPASAPPPRRFSPMSVVPRHHPHWTCALRLDSSFHQLMRRPECPFKILSFRHLACRARYRMACAPPACSFASLSPIGPAPDLQRPARARERTRTQCHPRPAALARRPLRRLCEPRKRRPHASRDTALVPRGHS
jgi:hypothetical protein